MHDQKSDVIQNLKHPPTVNAIGPIEIPHVEQYDCQGVRVYELNKADCQVIRLDFTFDAGRPYEHKNIVSSACAGMMREGTSTFGAAQIAEELDYLGATLHITGTLDFIHVRLITLQKNFSKALPIVIDILTNACFPEQEFEKFCSIRQENLAVELSKNEVISYRLLTQKIYGAEHPYGYNSTVEGYGQLTIQDLKEHYGRTITKSSAQIFWAGDIHDGDRHILNKLIDKIPQGNILTPLRSTDSSQIHRPMRINSSGNPTQASIRMGRKMFTRRHQDYAHINLLNVVLGGYFGSRLVSNIRERLGLTYGIYSTLDLQRYDGAMYISTEVSPQNIEQTISEIYKEMELLQSDLVSDEELHLVKNYISGNYLNYFDGPFNSLKAIKSLVLSHISVSDIESHINIMHQITSDDIRHVAQKYLNRNDFWEVVVVGKPT